MRLLAAGGEVAGLRWFQSWAGDDEQRRMQASSGCS
jgi:hypothetical protein